MIRLKTELFPWQQEAVNKLGKLRVGALYMDMSTGKTRTALELFVMRLNAGKVDHALWLCPCNTVVGLPSLLDKHAESWRDYITICGIESLSSSLRINSELLALTKRERVFLVVDESTLVKNYYAKRTNNISRIAQNCPYRYILSGTPITRNESDLFSQWYVLDWRILGYRSFYSFAANHLEYDPDRPGKVRRVLNIDYLSEKIAPYTFQVKREDCMTLPQKIYRSKCFYLSEEHDDEYSEVSEKFLIALDERRPATIYRLFNACSAMTAGYHLKFFEDSLTYERIYAFSDPEEDPRIQALLSALDELHPGKQVVINCKFVDEVTHIMQVLNRRDPGCAIRFDGDISRNQRKINIRKFENGIQYLVANKNCSQYGLNLQFCHNLVFYDSDWDYATTLQAEDRFQRYGQEHEINIISIVALKTIDEAIQKCLNKKERLLFSFEKELTAATKENLRKILKGVIE